MLTCTYNVTAWIAPYVGLSGKHRDSPAENDEAQAPQADDTAASTSSASCHHENPDKQSDKPEAGKAQGMQGRTSQPSSKSQMAEQPDSVDSMQPGVDDWGDFVS